MYNAIYVNPTNRQKERVFVLDHVGIRNYVKAIFISNEEGNRKIRSTNIENLIYSPREIVMNGPQK